MLKGMNKVLSDKYCPIIKAMCRKDCVWFSEPDMYFDKRACCSLVCSVEGGIKTIQNSLDNMSDSIEKGIQYLVKELIIPDNSDAIEGIRDILDERMG